MEKEISIHHQNKAKEIVDTLFDKNIFNPRLSRDDMNSVEDLLAFYIEMEYNSAKTALDMKIMLSRTIPKEHQTPEMLKFTKEREEDEKKKSETGSCNSNWNNNFDSNVIITKKEIRFRWIDIGVWVVFTLNSNGLYTTTYQNVLIAIPKDNDIINKDNFEIVK